MDFLLTTHLPLLVHVVIECPPVVNLRRSQSLNNVLPSSLRCLESSFNASEVAYNRSSTPAFEIVHSGMIIGSEMDFSIGFFEDRKVVLSGLIIDPSYCFETYFRDTLYPILYLCFQYI